MTVRSYVSVWNTGKKAPWEYYQSTMFAQITSRRSASGDAGIPAIQSKERTPTEHRAELDQWRAKAASQDHVIFGRKNTSKQSRHRDLAALGALLTFRDRPVGAGEGVLAGDLPIIRTNWSLVPANDNQIPEEGYATERTVEYEPSLDGVEAAIKHLPMVRRAEPVMLTGGRKEEARAGREIHGIPHGDDVEFGIHVDDDGKSHRVIVRIGRLQFSDGSQTERGRKMVMDQVVEADIRMPVGAMLHSREKSAADRGSEVDISGSNSHYRWIVRGRPAQPPKLTRKKLADIAISRNEAREMLDKAYANTHVMPEVKRIPDGFPYAPANLRQLFIGGRKGKSGQSGSQAWQDIFTEGEIRAAFNRALDAMQDEHVRLLSEAVCAKSLSQLGEARGYRGRHAIDAGRRLLNAANDNFEEAMMLANYARRSE